MNTAVATAGAHGIKNDNVYPTARIMLVATMGSESAP